jgi:hypothetical protein
LSFRRKPESSEIKKLDPGFRRGDELISASLSLRHTGTPPMAGFKAAITPGSQTQHRQFSLPGM